MASVLALSLGVAKKLVPAFLSRSRTRLGLDTNLCNLRQIPKQYEFGYAVKDDYSGDDFSHKETRDEHMTQGEYRVALPDGRVQVSTKKHY